MGASSNKGQKPTNITLEGNLSGKRPVPVRWTEEIKKSICKIITSEEETGTGFFMIINSYKYLITCYHVIENASNNSIKIEIWDKKIFNLNLNNNSSTIDKRLDVALIDIQELNITNIEFLSFDENYKDGCSQYKNLDIFTLSYQDGDELVATSGKFIKKDDLFFHTIDTERGSSGSPIILFTKKIIGIHKGYEKDAKLNVCIFIGEIINVFNKNKNIKNVKKKDINLLDNSEEENNLIEFNKKYNLNINSHITKLDLRYKNNCWEYLPKLKLID